MATLSGSITGATPAGTTRTMQGGIIRRQLVPYAITRVIRMGTRPSVKVWNGSQWIEPPTAP